MDFDNQPPNFSEAFEPGFIKDARAFGKSIAILDEQLTAHGCGMIAETRNTLFIYENFPTRIAILRNYEEAVRLFNKQAQRYLFPDINSFFAKRKAIADRLENRFSQAAYEIWHSRRITIEIIVSIPELGEYSNLERKLLRRIESANSIIDLIYFIAEDKGYVMGETPTEEEEPGVELQRVLKIMFSDVI